MAKTTPAPEAKAEPNFSPLQRRGETVGRAQKPQKDNRPEAAVQRKLHAAANNSPRVKQLQAIQRMANRAVAGKTAPIQKEATAKATLANHTALPDTLKSGIENLSGHSMDDVKVHYNSAQPAQLNAHAYAQGTDIHLGPGQEKHLPHEAWHVVQQKQGRVQATRQMKGGVSLNDDAGLEREADVMGERALSATTPVHAKTLKSASGIGNTHQAIQRRVGFEFQTNIALRNSQGDAPPLKTALFEATGWKIECDQGDLEFITDPFSNYGPLHQTMLNLVAWAHGMAQLPYVIPVEKQEQADQFDHPDDQHIREGILLDNQTRNLALMDANQGQLIANYFALGPASALTAAPQTTVGIPMEKIISSLHLVAAKEYTLGTGMGQKQVKLGAAQEREPTLVSAHDATVVLVNHLRQTHPDIPEMAWRKLEGIIGLAASYIRTANVPGRSSYSYVKVMAPMMSRVNFTALFNALPESVKPFLTPANVALAADLQANSRVFGVKGAIKDKAGPTIEEWVTSMTSGFDLLSRIGDFFSVEGIMEGSESMGEFDALDEADEKYDMPLVPIEFREMTKSVPYPLWPELTENIMIFANALIKAEFF